MGAEYAGTEKLDATEKDKLMMYNNNIYLKF